MELERLIKGYANVNFNILVNEANIVKNHDLIKKLKIISSSMISPTHNTEFSLGRNDLAFAEGHWANGQYVLDWVRQDAGPERYNEFNFRTKEVSEVKDSIRDDLSYHWTYSFDDAGIKY